MYIILFCFRFCCQIQEPPSIDHKSVEMLVGPILHILCSHEVNLLEPARIKLPLEFFKGKRELVHSGQWRVFHFQQEWADITDQLEMSVSLTDGIVTFKVKAFCRYVKSVYLYLISIFSSKVAKCINWEILRTKHAFECHKWCEAFECDNQSSRNECGLVSRKV